jgi:ADP-heptose:LPS heptosyltransferase
VVITGSTDERPLCDQLTRQVQRHRPRCRQRVLDLAGVTDIEQLCAVVGSARAVVANDTGVSHLATALAVPSVTLFGPTSPARWGPPPHRLHRVIWKGTPGDPHAERLDPGLAAITVPEVMTQVEALLNACERSATRPCSVAAGDQGLR